MCVGVGVGVGVKFTLKNQESNSNSNRNSNSNSDARPIMDDVTGAKGPRPTAGDSNETQPEYFLTSTATSASCTGLNLDAMAGPLVSWAAS